MELQLGLGLPCGGTKGFDLNSYVYQPKEINGSGFGSGYVPNRSCSSSCDSPCCENHNKRRFDDAFVVWKNKSDEGDDDDDEDGDDGKDPDYNSSVASNKVVDREAIVGWPPVKTRRKKLTCQYHSGRNQYRNDQTADSACRCGGRRQFVKVKMDGAAIARKIDLSLHNSFQTLTAYLNNMFAICIGNYSNYELTYQDREGDWLVAEDVSWRTFIRTVQRLKLSKTSS